LAEGEESTTLSIDGPPSPSPTQLQTTQPTSSPRQLQTAQPTSSGPRTQVEISIVIDDFPEEVRWKLLDFSGQDLIGRMEPGFYADTGAWISTLDLKPDSVYTFVITESRGRSNGTFCFLLFETVVIVCADHSFKPSVVARFFIRSVDGDGELLRVEYLGEDRSDRVNQETERNFHRSTAFVL
jgi:hypothetical protein